MVILFVHLSPVTCLGTQYKLLVNNLTPQKKFITKQMQKWVNRNVYNFLLKCLW